MENLNLLYEAILTGKQDQAIKLTREAIENNVPPKEIIDGYMVKAMEEIGRRFESHEAFVPELLMAARAMKGALELVRPLLAGGSAELQGRVVIGTVKGDLHDIGKNIVASMLEGCGFDVINLGVDISPEKFIEAYHTHKPGIICMSALLTTTMTAMKQVIDAFNQAGLRERVKFMIGGAPVTQAFSDEIGADGFSNNANAAVALAKSLSISTI